MTKKKTQKEQSHGTGIVLLTLMVLVLVAVLVVLTQKVDIVPSLSFDTEPSSDDMSGHFTSVYLSQSDRFFVPDGFPKNVFKDGYSDIDEASFLENRDTYEEMHMYKATLSGSHEDIFQHISDELENYGYNLDSVTEMMLVAEKKKERVEVRFVSKGEYEQGVEIDFWKKFR